MSDSPVMVVTGGSRGIGAGITRLAGERGYDVCVVYASAADRASLACSGVLE